MGHKDPDCWLKEENKSKQPKNFKLRTETGSAAIDGDDSRVEFLCVGIDVDPGVKTVIEVSDPNKTTPMEEVMSPTKAVTENYGESTEFGCTMAFPDSQALLSLPYFWIADTAASAHMTPHKMGMVKMTDAETTITLGNRQLEKSTQVADLHGMMCDR